MRDRLPRSGTSDDEDSQAATRRTRTQLFLLLVRVPALALGVLASTCVVIEEGSVDIPYGEESNAQAMEEEEQAEVMRESEL